MTTGTAARLPIYPAIPHISLLLPRSYTEHQRAAQATLLGTLSADLLYGVVDPRIRYS